MKRCDVLFLVRSLNAGGAERQLVLLAKMLQQQGLDVAVAQFYGGGIFAGDLLSSGVPLYDLRKRGRWSNFIFLWRLWKLVRLLRPRIAHGYLSVPNLILLLMKPVLKVHGTAVVCGVRASSVDLSMYDAVATNVDTLHRWALKFSDSVICNSSAGLRYVRRSLADSRRLHLVDNGIDCEAFRYTVTGRNRLRELWAVSENIPLIGLVGRHDPVKDHKLFLRAAARIVDQLPEARFAIVGGEDANFTPELERLAEELGISEKVIWAGHQSDLSAVYSAIDVLCLCSHSEGFPNAVAEAMCCGLPCVCTDVGDVRRLLGDTGWVIEGRDPNELADALQRAIANLPRWNREHPRRRIVENFSVDQLADRTLAVLAPLLK